MVAAPSCVKIKRCFNKILVQIKSYATMSVVTNLFYCGPLSEEYVVREKVTIKLIYDKI